MTDQPNTDQPNTDQPNTDAPPVALQGVIIQTSGDTVAAPSLDLVEYGVLYVDTDGYTSLMPWHMVARVAFFDAMLADKPEGSE